jgi:hypothetical protein
LCVIRGGVARNGPLLEAVPGMAQHAIVDPGRQ